ncbi:flagellar motor switch protein FliN [Buchnera aphidicola (Macrosiphoniella sanborni)]|uniref:Flagellar motor switch protein FliN n=1 Tax=Buchnera aphidicola (Macrosiphoniella sanborni) TaxID=1241865 RepID=A0A4D6YC79_9GAMM|nr:flagellar motor switch protein FliN [Buchnera aphidicola]QCI23648.1 flagellar motor switch protein FliN [Buchnera aphidicola (Macrosiphoniella sanborni)]
MNNKNKYTQNETMISSKNRISETEFVNETDSHNHEEKLNSSEKHINNKEIILNTSAKITVELGRSKIKIKDFLRFSKGSMLILDKTVKEPLDIFINGHLIASGEIVVAEKKYGIRITHIKSSLKKTDFLS